MEKEKIYLASADVAERAGCIDSSYRTGDGRYIISENALRDLHFHMTAEEYVTGLDIEIVTEEAARVLIRENNYAIGRVVETVPAQTSGEDGEGTGGEDSHAEAPLEDAEQESPADGGSDGDTNGNGSDNEEQ